MEGGNDNARKLEGRPDRLPGEYVAPDGVTPERDQPRRRDDIPSDYVLIEQTQRNFARRRLHLELSAELRAAEDRFIETYDVLIRSYAERRGIGPDEMADLAQDVWRGLMRSLEEFQCDRSRGRFRDWLHVVVVNKAREFRRNRAHRENRIKLTDRIDKLDSRCDDDDPARQFDHELRRELLCYALKRLRPKISETSYRIVELRFLEEHTVTETARLLNLTPRHVTFRLCRVLKKLRQLLDFDAEPSLVIG
ncbi:MAG: sigma-70 family RNA polymerase sigma factor [Planctomycetales bacterium]|nr:sigma-70 family RNA polymerase sigma factor [Planctomycetales bacterium]